MNSTLQNMRTRKSAREFTNELISERDLQELLESVRRAPSGKNSQPWKLALVQGEPLEKLRTALCEKFDAGEKPTPDFDSSLLQIYRGRAIDLGKALFIHKGIAREDKVARRKHDRANFELFGAPQAFVLTCNKEHVDTTLMDLGIFAGYLMLGLESLGYACCPQVSSASYTCVYHDILQIPETDAIAMVFPFGKPLPGSHVNAFDTTREPVENWFKTIK